ncbi:MAG: SLOG family protein [Pseudomonadota bacterium]
MRRAASIPRLIGYARVSTEDQATDPHIRALQAAGCSTIFQRRLQVRNARSGRGPERTQDGSEVADVELQAAMAEQHRRDEIIDALVLIREAAAEAHSATTGETWQPRSGSRTGPRMTAAQIDAREMAAARRRAREAALNPTGPRIAVTGDTAASDPSLIFDTLDRIRERHPDMVLVTKGARGAEAIASRWAATRQLPQIAVAPD